ncbi:MAG: macro domain-containing protein [Candidatus Heimdallarchaeota archaeon]|nr:macro domain-containing protein [Candidatus Heimdallarchaeota archaeon]
MIIDLIKGDITEIDTDAIVNAANNELWMGTGVAGAIKRKGGREIEEEALRKGPIQYGGAVETKAGKLKAKYIIHAAAMRSDGYIDEKSLKSSIISSLKLAETLQVKTIAFPALGTGVASYPVKLCAEQMIYTIKNFKPKTMEKVIIVLFNDEIYQIFKTELEKINIKEN